MRDPSCVGALIRDDRGRVFVRRELDYLVEVEGDLAAPRLEPGKHDAYAWVGLDNLELLMDGRTEEDFRLRDIVATALQLETRWTTSLPTHGRRSEGAG